MRHALPLVLAAIALALSAGCGSAPADPVPKGEPGPARAAVPPAPTAAAAAAAPAVAPGRDVKLAEKTDLIEFSYAWPGAAAAIPRLDARFRADARTRRQRTMNGARQDRAARAGEDFPFHPHSSETDWTVAGDTHGLLSLRGQTYVFTGGAHGNTAWEYLLWDRAADRDISPMSLFRDPAAAMALLNRAFCPALDAERAKKRGAPVTPDPTGKDWMRACPDLKQEVMVLSDPQAGGYTAIRVLLGPYDAGPYAEGTYEVRLPVTRPLVALLKPDRAGVLAPAR